VFVDSLGETRTPGPVGRLDLTDIMNMEAARKTDTHDEYLSRFYERLKRRKNHQIAIVATARKLPTFGLCGIFEYPNRDSG
jgi:hypothetical protein